MKFMPLLSQLFEAVQNFLLGFRMKKKMPAPGFEPTTSCSIPSAKKRTIFNNNIQLLLTTVTCIFVSSPLADISVMNHFNLTLSSTF